MTGHGGAARQRIWPASGCWYWLVGLVRLVSTLHGKLLALSHLYSPLERESSTSRSIMILRRILYARLHPIRQSLNAATMSVRRSSSAATDTANPPRPQPPQQEVHASEQGEGLEQVPGQNPLPLPEPEAGSAAQLDAGTGQSVKLGHLGPMVVNRDGTLSRIANWEHMSEFERQNTLRILGKRNQLRMETLRAEEDSKQDA